MLCLEREADMSHEQFVDRWLGAHAPLALEHGALVAKYVQSVVDSRLSPAAIEEGPHAAYPPEDQSGAG